ncbi:MAG: serine/threonine protein kinase, partial [Planctomycetota bacterium]|nr:serine/threonine protein kinase [Planctomycetota bacterium]
MSQETHPQRDPSASTFGLSSHGATEAVAPSSNPNQDRLLTSAPRVQHDGREVPALGGIPLLRKIGQGGMGAVYYGIHPRLRQEVAVKVLPFPLIAQDPVVVERFYREAQIAARVKSAHLVTVLDVNEEAGLFYLVMEYVAGVSAGSYVCSVLRAKGRGMDEGEALDLCIAASEGLAAAHREGVIHRDLKPDNILVPRMKNEAELDFTGAKIADLGLARDEASGNSLTGTYAAMGSLGYMPPEQAMDAKSVRKPGDVFGMGATLYALLAGKPPFKGSNSTAVLLDTLQGQQEPLRNIRPEVSENTARLVDKCLAKEPEKRFEDGEALLEALRACRSLLNAPPVDRAAQTLPAAAPVPPAGAPALLAIQPDSLALSPMTPPQGSLELSPIVERAEDASAPKPASGPAAPKAPAPKPARKPAAPEAAKAPEAQAAPASKARLYAIAGAAAAVLLLAGTIGLYLNGVRKDRAFLALRDKVLADNKPALKSSGADLNVAKSGLDAFLKENGHRDPSLLVPVRDLRNDLSKRQESLDARAAAFNEIVQKADRARSTDPAKALELLKQAQAAGKFDAEKGFPDINATVAPTVTERIEKAELAIREAASRAKAV